MYHTHTHTHVCARSRPCGHTHARAHTQRHPSTHTRAQTHTCTRPHVHTHYTLHRHTRTHTRTHIYRYKRARSDTHRERERTGGGGGVSVFLNCMGHVGLLQMVFQGFFLLQSSKHVNITQIITLWNNINQCYHTIIYFIYFEHHLESISDNQKFTHKKNGDHICSQSLGTTDSLWLNESRRDHSWSYLTRSIEKTGARGAILFFKTKNEIY